MTLLRFPLEDGSELLVRVEAPEDDEHGADVLGDRGAFIKDAVLGLTSASAPFIGALYKSLVAGGVLPAVPDKTGGEISNDVRRQLREAGHLEARVDQMELQNEVWTVVGAVKLGSFTANVHASGDLWSFKVDLIEAAPGTL